MPLTSRAGYRAGGTHALRAAVLAIVLVALTGHAGPAGAAEPVPEVACAPLCTVPGTTFATVPPVVVVRSGEALTWVGADFEPHTATSTEATKPCYHIPYANGSPGSGAFTIRDGVLYGNLVDKPCSSAAPLPGGGFVVRVRCIYHPLMTTAVVVLPA